MAVYYKDKKIQVLREPKYRCEIRNPNVIGTQEVSGAYSIRQTGTGDPDVSDILLKEHISYVKQIKGSTVKDENLIPYPYNYISQTINGVLFSISDDGVVTCNGTATSRAIFYLGNIYDYAQSYFMSGAPLGGDTVNTFSLRCISYPSGKWAGNDFGNGTAINHIQDDTYYWFSIIIESGYTCENLVFKPMVNIGATAKPWTPRFTDLKHAYIKAIKSTGRNLIDYFNGKFAITYGSVEGSGSNWVEAKGALSQNSEELWYTGVHSNGWLDCVLPTPFNITDRRCILSFDLTLLETVEGKTLFNAAVYGDIGHSISRGYAINNTTDKQHFELTVELVGSQISRLSFTLNSLHVRIENVMLSLEGAETSFSPYTEDIYELPETLELAEYDTFNPQTGEVVRGTESVTVDGTENWKLVLQNADGTCSFTWSVLTDAHPRSKNEKVLHTKTEIGNIKFTGYASGLGYSTLHIIYSPYTTVEALKAALSSNPIDIEYEIATESTTETLEKGSGLLKSWKYGSETIVQGETDNSKYGAMPTITQKYFIHKE